MLSKKAFFAVLFLFAALLLTGLWKTNLFKEKQSMTNKTNDPVIRYVAVGDSYTIGLGVAENERWPDILVKHLQNQGVQIELVRNLGISGYTVSDAITLEIPEFEKLKPDFATLLIGANDQFVNAGGEGFREEFKEILDRMQKVVGKNMIVITLPDYTNAPGGKRFALNDANSRSIDLYNSIIKEEAQKRGLMVADIAEVSRRNTSPEYFISDGLHPSGRGYQAWEEVIFPVVLEALTDLK